MTEADTLPDLSKWKPRGKRIAQAEKAYLAANGVKWCPKCRTVQPLDAFRADRSTSDGLRSICKACCSKKGRRWRTANPDKIAEKNRRYYEANREACLAYFKARAAEAMRTARRIKAAAVYFQHRTEYLKPLAAYALRHPQASQMMFGSHAVDALCAWYVGDITLEELREGLCS